ncbi:protein of unknown function; putative tRNA(5-methylaminomethyl-2-thiouridylate) methyltransferase [Bradyrhizobium sp. ORS 285]|uniref:hypothetical protein n=1 Tax=Bradyrhizobium sp. ORS 285 TaxID=115808 RepID=UPI0002409584|nr:hypothetical protein [Bradyrhizobium sp. ORS 285]CCD89832.1 hypothetical protein; putative tRNA(5-methylaminomethyl-2-thiouridylate) methyltransferase [Bradyrhizobium sp. ORS 285]SMX61538.1 protein of unknown function; putative tRNA(5-methylaminomethyl-2-thiouridylate) methyltransferase [Bradyrhizobium sp. ORS 285]
MSKSQTPSLAVQQEARRKLLARILSSPADIRRRFAGKPITLLKLIDPEMRFPKKLRIVFACLYLQQRPDGTPCGRFIIKGPRGGGKSKMLGALGFVRWFLKLMRIVNLGGSLEQAKGVYNYFLGHVYTEDAEAIRSTLPDEPTMLRTETEQGNYYRAVAASSKQVRGPHPDDLYIDEACEAKDEIILSALPMVDTAVFPLVIFTSTFHKIFGLFQEIWDKADELGYCRLSWDIFDVTQTFDPAIWDDPELNRQIPDLDKLKQRAAGRTGDPEGWVPLANIIQAWREKPSLDWFDVEYMGSRPSAAGMVNDPEDVDACVIDELGEEYAYRPGAVVGGGIDWGYSGMTVVDIEMAHMNNVLVELEARHFTQVDADVICEDVAELTVRYRVQTWHVDASHPFENSLLKRTIAKRIAQLPDEEQFACAVVEVPFGRPIQIAETARTGAKREVNRKLGTEKEAMLGNYRARFQRRLNRMQRTNKEGIWQHKRYRFQEGTDKPLKEDDHYPDAKMLAQRKFPLGRVASVLPDPTEKKDEHEQSSTGSGGLIDQVF